MQNTSNIVKKKIGLLLDKDLYQSVKVFAAQSNTTISKIFEDGARKILEKSK